MIAPSLAVAQGPEDTVALVRSYLDARTDGSRQSALEELERSSGPAEVRAALALAVAPHPVKPGLRHRKVFAAATVAPYVVFVPPAYDAKVPWPVHISLHGGGKGASWARCRSHWGNRPQKDFILVCPSTPAGRWWTPEGDATLVAVYREVLSEFNVDTDRVTIGGMSNGGTGTWHLAIKYPWLWAAIVPRCAASITSEPLNRNMAAIPAFLIHGDRDQSIEVQHSRTMVALLRQLGAEPEYREVPGGAHRFFPDFNREVVSWMLAARRKLPASFVYTPIHGNPTPLIYWLSVEGSPGTIEASIVVVDGHNQVSVRTQTRPTSVRVFLPSGLVDPSLPVRILVNGEERYRGRPEPSARDLLESFALSHDLSRTFDASVRVDLTEGSPSSGSKGGAVAPEGPAVP